ncbi:hypothetical protein [Pararhizobium qamdonense]|uniref:hypothetical protein n=1 Tax=Pararhizobium qamdonense TaxID=3031126 RepID=UPI0023E0E8A9|nr:hypothetical protein [Pararhizobium qamdonense]
MTKNDPSLDEVIDLLIERFRLEQYPDVEQSFDCDTYTAVVKRTEDTDKTAIFTVRVTYK